MVVVVVVVRVSGSSSSSTPSWPQDGPNNVRFQSALRTLRFTFTFSQSGVCGFSDPVWWIRYMWCQTRIEIGNMGSRPRHSTCSWSEPYSISCCLDSTWIHFHCCYLLPWLLIRSSVSFAQKRRTRRAVGQNSTGRPRGSVDLEPPEVLPRDQQAAAEAVDVTTAVMGAAAPHGPMRAADSLVQPDSNTVGRSYSPEYELVSAGCDGRSIVLASLVWVLGGIRS